MKKITQAMIPFGIYAFFVLLLKFLTFYLFPEYEMILLSYLFIALYALHLYLGTFILGFIFGRISQKG